MSEELAGPDYDLICVGSGAGGLTAAIVAAEHGLRVLVVEKDVVLGGVTAWSAGQLWIGGNHLAAELGIADSIEDAKSYLDFISLGLGDAALAESFLNRADAAVRFLRERAGIDFQVVRGFPDYYFQKAPGGTGEGRAIEVPTFELARLGALQHRLADPTQLGWGLLSSAELIESGGDLERLGTKIAEHVGRGERCAGVALSGSLLKAASDRDVELRTECRATRLLCDGQAVVGVEVVGPDDTPASVPARAVLLATGGYDWNTDLVRSFEHVGELASMTPATVQGDHITMAGEVGAMLVSALPEATPVMTGFALPRHEIDGRKAFQALGGARPRSIIVNAAGRRFADDTFYPAIGAAMAAYDGAAVGYPNRPAWLIFDSAHRQQYPLGTLPPGVPLPDGLAVTAEDLATLADQAGIDPEGLIDTIHRFNEFCELGVDEDYGRGEIPWTVVSFGDPAVEPNRLLGPITVAPFSAVRLTEVGIGIPSVGVRVDADGRVQSVRGETIDGLYAAGNAAARSDIPGYQSGIANSRGLSLGYSAAMDLVRTASAASVGRA